MRRDLTTFRGSSVLSEKKKKRPKRGKKQREEIGNGEKIYLGSLLKWALN